MRGERTIKDIPFRYGGIMHNYEADIEWWQSFDIKYKTPKKYRNYDYCYACGGKMQNCYSPSGTLLKKSFPYMAFYKIFKGKNKGYNRCKIICRACAYAYGKGVIEMDGKTYQDYYEFNEIKYKADTDYKYKEE